MTGALCVDKLAPRKFFDFLEAFLKDLNEIGP
jgi:hypothetical protein